MNKLKIDWNLYYNKIEEHEKIEHKTKSSNKKGIVFTNKKIVKEMVKSLSPKLSETIFEPSVGGGVFIIAILEYIINAENLDKNELLNYVENKLFFSDIVEEHILFTKKLIMDILERYEIQSARLNGIWSDSLLNEKHYDIIIGNPPYIRIKNLESDYLNFLRSNFKSCEKGNIDIYYAFIEMTHKYSNRSSLIVPNSYLENNSALNLRNIIKKDVFSIRDFREVKHFSNASTYTLILTLDKSNNSDIFKYGIYNNDFEDFDVSLLDNNNWNFSFHNKKDKYKNRELLFTKISNIYSGIATLSDKLFLIDKSEMDGDFYLKEYKNTVYKIEKKICIDYKKISKNMGDNNQAIIFPYKNINKIIDEDELKKEFPKAYEYFCAIRKDLEKRDKGKVSGYDAWYAYGRRQGFNQDFNNKKVIMIPLLYKEDSFEYKEIFVKSRFIHSSGYVIIPNKNEYENVINILNSLDFQEYLLLFGKKMPGKDINYNRITATLLKKYGIKQCY